MSENVDSMNDGAGLSISKARCRQDRRGNACQIILSGTTTLIRACLRTTQCASISHLKRELLQQPPTSHSTLHSVCVSVVETEAH